jgi:CoA:oxalate CoA-transferase
MRCIDLLTEPRFATASVLRANLKALLAEIGAWVMKFTDLDRLRTQVSNAGLAIAAVRSTIDLADSERTKDWGAVVELDNRSGDTTCMSATPWRFSEPALPRPRIPALERAHNMDPVPIEYLPASRVPPSQRSQRGAVD